MPYLSVPPRRVGISGSSGSCSPCDDSGSCGSGGERVSHADLILCVGGHEERTSEITPTLNLGVGEGKGGKGSFVYGEREIEE